MVRFQSTIFRSIFATLIISLALQGAQVHGAAFAENATGVYNEDAPQDLKESHLVASSAVLIDSKSGKVLFEKNADTKMFPASTTKVMTLMLAIEYGHLDDQITIPQEAANVPVDSSLVPVDVGEKMIYRDLLYGFMLRSGNDAGNAIAVIVAGSTDAFVEMMNERAKALGLENTHFTNAHGYHDADHYTTAKDMAKIAQEAMKDPLFREIVKSYEYVLPQTGMHDARRITSSDQMINPASEFYDASAIGIKTGFTSNSGQCFVGASLKDGKELIAVVFNSTNNGRWEDTQRLYDYGYTRYVKHSFAELYALVPLSAQITDYHPDDENEGLVNLVPIHGETDDYSVICLPEEYDEVVEDFAARLSVTYTRELKAEILEGDILGTLSLTTDGGEVLTTTVIAGRDVKPAPPKFSLTDYVPQLENVNVNFVKFILILFALIILLMFTIYFRAKARRKRRRREALRRQREMRERRRYYSNYYE